MRKKIVVSLILVLILLAIGGGFFWWQGRETPIEKWEAAKVSPEEDYIVKETPEGKIVENKKIGLIYEIPKDWNLENGDPTRFSSPDAKFKGGTSVILEKGCKVYVYASYIKTNLDTLKQYIDTELSRSSLVTESEEPTVIKVGNYSALRYKYFIEKFGMFYISVDFPAKDKLYKIRISGPTGEIEYCEAEFNKFLEKVSIE